MSAAKRRYDLHPVVRGVGARRMGADEKKARGELVVNIFTSQSPDTWDDADSLDELAPGLQIVTTLTQLGRFEEALNSHIGGVSVARSCSTAKRRSRRLRCCVPSFPEGWDGETVALSEYATRVFSSTQRLSPSVTSTTCKLSASSRARFASDISQGNVRETLCGRLRNLAVSLGRTEKLAQRERLLSLALDLAKASGDKQQIVHFALPPLHLRLPDR